MGPLNILKNPQDPSSVTVGSSSTSVLVADSSRTMVILTNDSDETMYLGFGNPAQLHKGVPLVAEGGNICINDFSTAVYYGSVTAICASGGKVLTIQEFKS